MNMTDPSSPSSYFAMNAPVMATCLILDSRTVVRIFTLIVEEKCALRYSMYL